MIRILTAPGHVTYPLSSLTPCGSQDLAPTFAGGAASHYSISPDLPKGLTLDEKTGHVWGSPERIEDGSIPGVLGRGKEFAKVFYMVTARNDAGSSMSKITLQ